MFNLDGGEWIDIFGIVYIIRLLLVLAKLPPLTMAEAGLWSVTIASFAYSNGGPRGQA